MSNPAFEKDSDDINHTSIPINDYTSKYKHLENDQSEK